jgi:LruC domain-containing protein
MPFDPFMVPDGGNLGTSITGNGKNEVHLASVNTTYKGVLTGDGYVKTSSTTSTKVTGFVWVLIIPDGWQWPIEGISIGIAYPQFINWCNSGGTTNTDWYNYPTAGKVVPR